MVLLIGQWLQIALDFVALLMVVLVLAYFLFGGRFKTVIRRGEFKMFVAIKGPNHFSHSHQSDGVYRRK